MDVERKVELGSGRRRDHSEPMAQERVAPMTTAAAQGDAPPETTTASRAPRRMPTPASPSSTPTMTSAGGAGARRPSHGNSVIHSGVEAMINAATLEGIHCSAQQMEPFPTPSSSPPEITAAPQFRGAGAGVPRVRRNAYNIAPATVKRSAAIKSGGQVPMAIRIAR